MSLLDTASLVVTPNGTKASKLYSVVPSDGSGDLDVTRATTATRVNSSGLIESVASNVPRLDYTNGTCPSILVEPQRTNLFVYSEKLISGFAFSFTGGVFTVDENTTDTLDPFGNNNADKFTTTSNFNDSYTSTSGSGNLTLSIFAKKGTNDTIQLYHQNVTTGNLFATTFNLNTGTIVGSSGTVTPKIEQFENGWYRCSITGADTLAAGNIFRVSTYTGTSYLFGWQLEAGSYATSYIPTTSASVTRNADVISKTGISSLINSEAGVIYYEGSALSNNTNARLIELNENLGSVSNNVYFRYEGNDNLIAFTVFSGGALQCNISYSLSSQTDYNKMAFVWALNRFEIWVNGNKVAEDTSGVAPVASTLNKIIFYDRNSASYFDGNLKTLAIWKTALTNTQLAQLTTI
jgi:hypothetical protein